jgi:hypothetical protein
VLVFAALAWPFSMHAAPPPAEGDRPEARIELPGKPTGPIVVEHSEPAEPAVGIPLAFSITARVEGAVGALRIEANASSPRAVLVTPPLLTSVADGVYAWTITVVPLTADAGYLTVIVSGNIDGVAQARSVTLSLRSAAAPDAVSSAALTDGETLIALPVRESP